jgi:hypothetical protein
MRVNELRAAFGGRAPPKLSGLRLRLQPFEVTLATREEALVKEPDWAMKRVYLERHIPYRLQAIDGLAWYCERVRLKRTDQPLDVTVQGVKVSGQLFTNGIVETGLASLRAMTEFLGFKVARDADRLADVDRTRFSKGDSAWIEDFGSAKVGADAAAQAGQIDPDTVTAAFVYALRLANKGVAHLTYGDDGTDVERVELACLSTWRLTVTHLYRGSSLLHAFGGGKCRNIDEYRYPARVAEVYGRFKAGLDVIQGGPVIGGPTRADQADA